MFLWSLIDHLYRLHHFAPWHQVMRWTRRFWATWRMASKGTWLTLGLQMGLDTVKSSKSPLQKFVLWYATSYGSTQRCQLGKLRWFLRYLASQYFCNLPGRSNLWIHPAAFCTSFCVTSPGVRPAVDPPAVFHQPMKQLDPWNPCPKIWKPEHCCTAHLDLILMPKYQQIFYSGKLSWKWKSPPLYWKIIYIRIYHWNSLRISIGRNAGSLVILCHFRAERPRWSEMPFFAICSSRPDLEVFLARAIWSFRRRHLVVLLSFSADPDEVWQCTGHRSKTGAQIGWRFDLWVPNWVN